MQTSLRSDNLAVLERLVAQRLNSMQYITHTFSPYQPAVMLQLDGLVVMINITPPGDYPLELAREHLRAKLEEEDPRYELLGLHPYIKVARATLAPATRIRLNIGGVAFEAIPYLASGRVCYAPIQAKGLEEC